MSKQKNEILTLTLPGLKYIFLYFKGQSNKHKHLFYSIPFICNNLTSMQNAIVSCMLILGKIMLSIFPTNFLFTRFLRPEFPDQTQVMISCRINIKLSIWYPAPGGAVGGLYIKYFLILKINSARSFLSRLDLFSILCWAADLNICPSYKVLINFNTGDIVVTWLITLRRPI